METHIPPVIPDNGHEKTDDNDRYEERDAQNYVDDLSFHNVMACQGTIHHIKKIEYKLGNKISRNTYDFA